MYSEYDLKCDSFIDYFNFNLFDSYLFIWTISVDFFAALYIQNIQIINGEKDSCP